MDTACRLCLQPCDFNDRLSDRHFREKAQDIFVLYLQIGEESLSIVCDFCQSKIERFYEFKWKCRQNEKLRRNSSALVGQGTVIELADVIPPELPKPKPLNETKTPKKPKKNYYKRLTDRAPRMPYTEEQLALKPKEEWLKERKKRVCELCGKIIYSNRQMKSHMNQHRGVRPYACDAPDCGGKFSCIDALNQHNVRVHSNERHPCPKCGKMFTNPLTLRNHSRRHLEKLFQCEICHLKVHLKCQLTKHMLVHTQQRDHKCEFCEKAFYSKQVLELHRRSHTGERPYACHVCDFSHAHRVLYVKHMQKFHPGEEIRKLTELQRLAAKASAESSGQ